MLFHFTASNDAAAAPTILSAGAQKSLAGSVLDNPSVARSANRLTVLGCWLTHRRVAMWYIIHSVNADASRDLSVGCSSGAFPDSGRATNHTFQEPRMNLHKHARLTPRGRPLLSSVC